MTKREWSCNKVVGGYMINLKYGEHNLHSFIEKEMVAKSLSPNKYVEYKIIRLNRMLADSILPLAQTLDHRRYE